MKLSLKRLFIQNRLKKQKQGSVLVAVVLVLMLVSFWVLGFTKETLSLQREWGRELERKRAYQAALAGVEYSLFLLESQKNETLDGSHRFENAEFRFQVRNEEGKWDLNSLIDGDGELVKAQQAGVARFLSLIGLKEAQQQIIDKIADWIDRDGIVRGAGAESDQYAGYNCRNNGLESFSEWLLVLDQDEQKAERLRKGCTLYSSGKINVNTAPAVVLASLSENIDESLVKAILSYRSRRRFASIEELQKLQGMTDAIYRDIENKLIFKGSYYSIWTKGTSGSTEIQVGVVVKREVDQWKWIWFKKELKNEDFFAWNDA